MKRLLTTLILCLGLQISIKGQSTSDIENIVQVALDFKEIQEYYHPEIESRLPIKIVDNDLISNSLHLTKFDQRVEFWDRALLFQLGKVFFIEFQEFEADQESAKTTFFLRGEGVQVDLTLKKEKGTCIITKNRIIEK